MFYKFGIFSTITKNEQKRMARYSEDFDSFKHRSLTNF